ncbi:PD-(D/E)XK nuclease domain-containing protein [Cohnella sp.]|uniref:PD-(D/E)XK nuclease domain-containing protein n=1 Tax=Cohnella sp. TaxID=1883426 RepID=UPI0035627AFF
MRTFSYNDVGKDKSEALYHAFVLGMMVHLGETYEVRSNRESGYGRYDVMVIPRDKSKGQKGIIIEFKKADRYEEESLDEAVVSALRQIETKQYDAELRAMGISDIVKLGIAFKGKQVKVQSG